MSTLSMLLWSSLPVLVVMIGVNVYLLIASSRDLKGITSLTDEASEHLKRVEMLHGEAYDTLQRLKELEAQQSN